MSMLAAATVTNLSALVASEMPPQAWHCNWRCGVAMDAVVVGAVFKLPLALMTGALPRWQRAMCMLQLM